MPGMTEAIPLRIGSLFSGYGGLDLAVEQVIGGELAWVSEYEPPTKRTPNPTQGAARVLAHRFPDVPNLGDITAVDWSIVEPVEIVTGGSPCQDVSAAGKRAGMRTGTRSGLWAAMTDAIDIIRPRLVVWENVRGALSAEADSAVEPCPFCVGDERGPHLRALGRVLGDLAELGYDAVWCGLRAADVGAPHARFRVFVLAWPAADADSLGPVRGGSAWRRGSRSPHGSDADADTNRLGLIGQQSGLGSREDTQGRGPGTARPVPDAASDGRDEGWPESAGQQRGSDVAGGSDAPAGDGGGSGWGDYGTAIARWESVLGRVAPPPTGLSTRGGQRLSPVFVEWLMGLAAGWVTGVPDLSRNDQLKILGNGVVPQQAAAAIGYLLQFAPPAVARLIDQAGHSEGAAA